MNCISTDVGDHVCLFDYEEETEKHFNEHISQPIYQSLKEVIKHWVNDVNQKVVSELQKHTSNLREKLQSLKFIGSDLNNVVGITENHPVKAFQPIIDVHWSSKKLPNRNVYSHMLLMHTFQGNRARDTQKEMFKIL